MEKLALCAPCVPKCAVLLLLLLLPQEIQPSGPNGPTVSVGAYVRDLLVEQVSSWGARGERGVLGCAGWLLSA